ncbi:ADP-ribosylglycohydrolase family protein [Candidatus Saccharibacteria bacterium]|nr:ADP-ribosylglycohydrolase family protein [Candidatus Saccharibacteria bacterium]
MNNTERAEGAMIGLAVGDSLGANFEFGFPGFSELVDSQIEMVDGPYPAGAWTDDTSMALCLADSLINCSGYDSYDVMERYKKWCYEGYRTYDGKPAADVGGQTKAAIDEYVKHPVVFVDDERDERAGNGALMRLAPVVIARMNEGIVSAMELAQISARETHFSEVVETSAEIFAAMLYLALSGVETKEEVIKVSKYSSRLEFSGMLSEILGSSDISARKSLQSLGGYTVDALKIAVWAFVNFDDFETGVKEVIKLGGDTDTNAAIYGQIAGAYYGLSGIPVRWREKLLGYKEMCELADKLASMKVCPIMRTRFEEDEQSFS